MKKLLLFATLLLTTCLFSQSYEPDPSFANNGTSFNNGVYFYPIDVRLVNNNYYLISQKKLCKINYNGTIDNSFGTNGFIALDSDDSEYFITGFKYLNGYFYVYGTVNDADNNDDIFVCKIDEQGNFDSMFGTGNFAVVNFDGRETINDFVPDASGNLFCIGSRDGFDATGEHYSSTLIYFKINSNGTLNAGFETNGYKSLLINNTSKGNFVTAYGSNYLLVGKDTGIANDSGRNERLFITRVDENGNVVNSFGTNGSVLANLDQGSICSIEDVQILDDNLYVNFFHEQSVTQTGSNILKLDLTTTQTLFNNEVSYTYDMQAEPDGLYITTINLCQQVTEIFCERDFNLSRKLLNGAVDTGMTPYTYSFPSVEMGYTDDQSVKVFRDENGKVLLAGVSTLQNAGSGFSFLRLQEQELSFPDLADNNLAVYPNPFTNSITVVRNVGQIANIILTDLSGRIINLPSTGSNTLNLSCLQNSGMYIMTITTANTKTFTKKIIKQ